ncbi:TKL protein kinase [Phytophthora megakarya]|uniref:TKL protein kinase n=1 Tax=Phytophthora megakarya TaxID=4795 RepID=A0A225UJ65_9STRA|nr:TKL protein kinase [Phytophthora megakarya]
MSNCLLSTYPADLEFMTSVVHVDFSENYFKDYPVKFSHDSMESLNLSTNALTACSGDFPNMTHLDLSGNTLTAIPSNIYDMPKLKTLNLSGNSFESIALTPDEVTFLQNLETFTIDTFGDVSGCSGSAQATISGVAVCTSTGTGGSSSGSGGSSNTGAIVGGIVGAIVVALILGKP